MGYGRCSAKDKNAGTGISASGKDVWRSTGVWNPWNGGAFFTNFKLLDLYGEDICVLVERLCGLDYSLKTVIEILNQPSENRSDVIM